MKLKVGDRVSFVGPYKFTRDKSSVSNFWWDNEKRKGVIIYLDDTRATVKEDHSNREYATEFLYDVAPCQCKRLIKKTRKSVWVVNSCDGLHGLREDDKWEDGCHVHNYEPTDVNCTEFVEVRKKCSK